jgi:hypothetical protein
MASNEAFFTFRILSVQNQHLKTILFYLSMDSVAPSQFGRCSHLLVQSKQISEINSGVIRFAKTRNILECFLKQQLASVRSVK